MLNLFDPVLDDVVGNLGQMMQDCRGSLGHLAAEVARSNGVQEEIIQAAAQGGHLITESLGSIGGQLNKNRAVLLGPVLYPPFVQVFDAK